jgi:hypothetical protein
MSSQPKRWTLEWVTSTEDWSWEKLNAFEEIPMESYVSRTALWFRRTLSFCRKIMDEAHYSRYSIHPGTNNMYQDLKKNFWWMRMKREIVKYVSECDTY